MAPSEKISALPAAGALTGAELLPIVQGGMTMNVPLSTLQAWLFGGPSPSLGLNLSRPLGSALCAALF